MRRQRHWVMLAAVVAVASLALIAIPSASRDAIGQGKSAGDEAGIRAALAAYVAAMSGGDLDAIMAHWDEQGDFIDEAGKATRGKAELTARFKESLPFIKGKKIASKIHSIKFLRPEICLVDGSIEVSGPDGTKENSRYAVVWSKSGDKWLISSARDLPAEVTDLPTMAAAQLQGLEWLVGDWTDDGVKADVALNVRWDTNKAFLLMSYSVKRDGGDPLQVTVRVGWDPVNSRIRSWTFDSNGGYGEGFWQKDGKKWIVGTVGVLPDGGTGGATQTYEFVDASNFVWKATDRDIDGQPLADAEVKLVRSAKK